MTGSSDRPMRPSLVDIAWQLLVVVICGQYAVSRIIHHAPMSILTLVNGFVAILGLTFAVIKIRQRMMAEKGSR